MTHSYDSFVILIDLYFEMLLCHFAAAGVVQLFKWMRNILENTSSRSSIFQISKEFSKIFFKNTRIYGIHPIVYPSKIQNFNNILYNKYIIFECISICKLHM